MKKTLIKKLNKQTLKSINYLMRSMHSTWPAEPVRSVRPWPDQLFGKIIKFLFLLGIFQGLRTSEALY